MRIKKGTFNHRTSTQKGAFWPLYWSCDLCSKFSEKVKLIGTIPNFSDFSFQKIQNGTDLIFLNLNLISLVKKGFYRY